MLSSPLNLSVTYTNNNLIPNTCLSHSLHHFAERYQLLLKSTRLEHHPSPKLAFITSHRGLQLCSAFHSDNASNFLNSRNHLHSNYLERESSPSEINPDNFFIEQRSDRDKNEMERRMKIGRANKGRIPWNKGKKHTPGTRELISVRTKEALKDPKVRKKMSECPRTLSEETKAKIRVTITQQWRERIKKKRARERFISMWSEGIAQAAKRGGPGENELEWDSYEKMEQEIVLQQLQRSADVAKAKEMAQIRAERRAKAKAEKVKMTLQKQVAKVKGLVKKKKKTKEEKEELAVAHDLKLKQRLTKIHRKRLVNEKVGGRGDRAWERLDIESLKREIRKDDVSLADQIREVNNKRAEVLRNDNFAPNHSSA
ncbi:hypothetical protein LXL04_001924 [Taraxacum kok-saghyz]